MVYRGAERWKVSGVLERTLQAEKNMEGHVNLIGRTSSVTAGCHVFQQQLSMRLNYISLFASFRSLLIEAGIMAELSC